MPEIMKENLEKIIASLKAKFNRTFEIGVVVSRGLGEFLESLEEREEFPFTEVPGLNAEGNDLSTAKFVAGKLNGKNIIVMHGRIHMYRGYRPMQVALPIFAMKELGCKILIINCVVGGINKKYNVGDIISITDHINMTGRSPLYGTDFKPYGSRFFDMTDAYSTRLSSIMKAAGKEIGLKIKEGVYIEYAGPTGETNAEVRAAKLLGGDMIGFHVVNEVVAARYCGLEVAVAALVTNFASAYSGTKIKYEDIQYNRQCASGYNSQLLANFIKKL